MSDLSPDDWRRLIDDVQPPSYGEVATALADAMDLPQSAAFDRVDEAIEAGILVENQDAGAFGELRVSGEEPGEEDETNGSDPTPDASETDELDTEPPSVSSWADADFTDPDSGRWTPAQIAADQWMCREGGKAPYAPWTDPDAPVECTHADHDDPTTCDQCAHHAGYKWGSDGSREYVHSDHETAREWADMDPTLSDDLVFIQRDADPFAFVDGDDVRDPDTGEIHPAFEAILEHLGLTYADISTSGSGVHAVYRGEIPIDDQGQAVIEIDDEPWGSNDDPPAVEIYANKHVCIATGDHVPGSGTAVAEWNDDPLRAMLEAAGYSDNDPEPSATADVDLENHTPSATDREETTSDIRDIFAALDRLDARRVAEATIVHEWNDSANTSGNNRAFVPTWGPNANGTANIVDDEIWQDTGGKGYGGPAVMAAIDAHDIDIDHRDQPSDVRGADWMQAVEHLRDLGFSIPELVDPADDEYTVDPREVDVVMDPQRAWEAASRVVPDDLDDEHGLPVSDGGEAFTTPHTDDTLDVVRAVAAVDDIAAPDEPLRDADYDRAYRRARDAYGAPLPEYVTAEDAATRWDTAIGAVAELDFFDLDRDAFTPEISEADDDGDVAYYIDPTPVDGWRDSESGESVLVFESGTIYDADTEATIDALRVVALEYGLIDTPTGELRGDDFKRAYRLARSDYRAPLPRLAIGTPDVTPVLPAAAELVDDVHARDQDDLEAAWQEVESLYCDLATSNGDVTVLQALPSLGKTTSAMKAAAKGVESTYLAPRKELMKQAAAKAEEHGASYLHLPVFGGGGVNDLAVEEAVKIVRERGKNLLRQEWVLQSLIEQPVFEDSDEDSDDVDVDRATCPTAEGDHGEAWALAVHTARELDYTPRDIHTRAKALFGSELPCQEDGDCEYSEGWDRVSDPKTQADLLIGSYGHAHVESARTTYSRDERGRIDRGERAVVLDEFIGNAYTEDFGSEFLHHAVWLASALRDDVDDRQDLLCEADLWGDDWVRAWVRGDGAEEGQPGEVGQRAVQDLRDLTVAVSTAAEFLEDYDAFASSHDLEATLEELHGQFPDLTASDADDIADELRRAVDRIPDQESQDLLNWLRDDIIDSLETYRGVDPEAAIPDVIAGDLRELIDDAVSAARAGHDGAVAMLNAASTALEGGDAGTRELAVYADDGYAHRLAHRLLEGLIAPDGDDGVADRIDTEAFAFDPDADSTTLKHVRIARDDDHYNTVLVDRDHQGATVLSPPSRRAGNGEECPVVGLDATARRDLWSLMLGTDVHLADIHDSRAERARFLRDHLGLQVVQTADRAKPYEGDPGGKDLDADIALLEEINEQFSGVYNAGARDGESVTVGKPACITTKCVRSVLESDERLDDVVAEWDNYGNITGDNDLGKHTLGAVLGTQHYGDAAVEKMAALAGEEVARSGHGAALDYGSSIANTYLKHMREDQLMQAILRFTRGDGGAVVFAHTSALRRDLPCERRGQVVKSWSETATTIARTWQRVPDQEFTIGDVADSVDVSRRQVRRVLDEFTRAGYLEKRDPGEGLANEFTAREQPSAGEVELPSGVDAPLNPDTGRMEHTYTWNVRVASAAEGDRDVLRAVGSTLPAPAAEIEGAPPG